MKERPILFSGSMVRAILDGRKTQTRRVMTPQPEPIPEGVPRMKPYDDSGFWWLSTKAKQAVSLYDAHCLCPYGGKADRLWVKETFMPMPHLNARAFYRATDPLVGGKWKPSIFMPRNYSRITLEVTKVRVERLQDISEEDAKAEGVEASTQVEMKDGSPCYSTPYQILWNQINGTAAWDKNPWVWVIDFKRL